MSKPSTDAVSLPITVSNPSGSRSILLVHGLTSAAGTWWQLVPRLTALDFAVTTVDLRGHGLAPKADNYRLEDFARDLVHVHPLDGSPWDVVVGHSLGAASAVAAAASDPDWTKRLVLLDPAIMLADDQADLYGTEWPKQVAPATLEQIQQAEPGAHPIFHAQRLLFTQQVTPEVVTQVAHDMKPWDARRQLRELQVPVLVLSADPAVDPTFLQPEILVEYSSLPTVTQHVIAGAGHSVHRDDLEQTFNQLRDFFSEQGL